MRRFSTPALCTLAALVLTSVASPAYAQWPPPLGIDCHLPRGGINWNLFYDPAPAARARCEADRAQALTWTQVVLESAKKLRHALDNLPPPLQDSLRAHMASDDNLDAWRWSDPAVEALLVSLEARAPYRFRDPLHTVRAYATSGVLEGTSYRPEWRARVRARLCEMGPREYVLVWMEAGWLDGLDRWSPRRVRQVEADRAKKRPGPARPQLGMVVDRADPGDPPALVYVGDRGRETPLTASCWSTVNIGTEDGVIGELFSTSVKRSVPYDARQACPVPTDVGYRLVHAERRNGVWIRPPDGIDDPAGVAAGVTRVPGAGGILDAVELDEAWQVVEDNCRPAVTIASQRTRSCGAAGEDGVQLEQFFYQERRADDPQWDVRGTSIEVVPINLSAGAVVTPHPTLPNAYNIAGTVTPATAVHRGRVVSADCNDPSTPSWDLTPSEVTCTSPLYGNRWCPDEHGNAAPYGLRRCWLREISEGWAGPTFDVQVRTVTDHCFDLTSRRESQSRTGAECEVVPTTTATTTGSTSYLSTVHNDDQVPDPDWIAPAPCNTPEDPDDPNHPHCGDTAPLVTQTVATTTTETHTETGTDQGPCDCPAGWTGSIVQERDFRWHDRDWAVRATNPSGAFALDLIAAWFDAASQHAPGEARVYSNMRSELEGRQSDWLEPAQGARDFGPEVYTVWLEADWHEESSTCSPPVPNSGGGGPTSWLAPDGETYEFWSPEADHQVDLPADNIGFYDPDDDGGR